MAVLGFHAVVCLIAITIISKLLNRSSFVHIFVTNGLFRFLAPTNSELKALLPPSKEKLNQRNRKKKRDEEEAEGFNIPKSSPFQFKLIPVDVRDLTHFELYASLHWLSLCVPIVLMTFSLSEIYNYALPQNTDFNTSILFLLIVVSFILQILTSLTSYLISNVEERGFMLSIGAVYFLFSFIFTMNVHRVFDIKMLEAYDLLGNNIADFIEKSEVFINGTSIHDYRPTNPLMMYISLSIFFSLLSSMLVFPNFRAAQMYIKALEIDTPFKQFCDHVAFLLPAFILTCFSKPVVYQLVQGPRQILTGAQLDMFRVYLVCFWLIMKFATRISHLQSHLNLAFLKVSALRNESGKIKNFEIQSLINRYYRYICCAAIQYYGPVLLALFCTLLLKGTSNISWIAMPPVDLATDLKTLGPVRFIFDHDVCRAFFSFTLVTILLINFSLQLMGVVYHKCFA